MDLGNSIRWYDMLSSFTIVIRRKIIINNPFTFTSPSLALISVLFLVNSDYHLLFFVHRYSRVDRSFKYLTLASTLDYLIICSELSTLDPYLTISVIFTWSQTKGRNFNRAKHSLHTFCHINIVQRNCILNNPLSLIPRVRWLFQHFFSCFIFRQIKKRSS